MSAQPYDARHLPELPDCDEMKAAFHNLIVAVNGFPYNGATTDAVTWTLRWLRANPAEADVLLGRGAL
ncbi:hypothetical protein AB0K35_28310 [Micromonospora sp. NPDC053740]|uniref:hypothetical protein n=1 Tax=Micromonospora sp. NPDC053740 TaxID=3155173 RepID=UPI0034271193